MGKLLLDRVGEFFDDRVCKEPLTHLSKLRFDVLPSLPTFRKRHSKQLADTDIFHPREAERAQRVLARFPLRVQHGRLQLDGDGGFHARGIIAKKATVTVELKP